MNSLLKNPQIIEKLLVYWKKCYYNVDLSVEEIQSIAIDDFNQKMHWKENHIVISKDQHIACQVTDWKSLSLLKTTGKILLVGIVKNITAASPKKRAAQRKNAASVLKNILQTSNEQNVLIPIR